MSLQEMFKIADIQANRIETAIKHTHQLFPISPEAIENMAKYLNRIFDLAPKLLAFYYEIKKRS